MTRTLVLVVAALWWLDVQTTLPQPPAPVVHGGLHPDWSSYEQGHESDLLDALIEIEQLKENYLKCNVCKGTGWQGQFKCVPCKGDGVFGN